MLHAVISCLFVDFEPVLRNNISFLLLNIRSMSIVLMVGMLLCKAVFLFFYPLIICLNSVFVLEISCKTSGNSRE